MAQVFVTYLIPLRQLDYYVVEFLLDVAFPWYTLIFPIILAFGSLAL